MHLLIRADRRLKSSSVRYAAWRGFNKQICLYKRYTIKIVLTVNKSIIIENIYNIEFIDYNIFDKNVQNMGTINLH